MGKKQTPQQGVKKTSSGSMDGWGIRGRKKENRELRGGGCWGGCVDF